MQTHPIFTNIRMHSDDELAQTLGVEIAERETIHQWPLSCVQRLRLADGTKRVYKSQLPPTVEPAFYESASSPLLPRHRMLDRLGECDTMTFEWIDAPLLRDTAGSDAELVEHGRQVVARIGEIRGELPVYLDLGSVDAWSVVTEVALEKLRRLIQDGRFGSMDLDAVEQVRQWATSPQVVETVTACPRVIHGDLTAEQVFVTGDGYRVIDWQRPVVGPPEVDLVALLVGAVTNRSPAREPRRHVDATVVGVFWFLRLYWAVEAQFDLFPEFRGPLFDQWSSEAIAQILQGSP
jgi:Phosphotransferase enzyme family